MKLPSQPWLRLVIAATALVFTGVAIYIYGFQLTARLHPDDAVMALLAEKVLHARSPVVADWYYANGDVWVFGPQLIALLPVAFLGLGMASLLISLLLGFALQLFVLVKAYARLSGELWIGVFAALATSLAWSSAHVDYVYVQVAYGFVTWLYVLSFTLFGSFAEAASRRPRSLALAGLLIALIAVQNPTRSLVYLIAPLIMVCLWPWRSFPARHRLTLLSVVVAGWIVAYVVYKWLILPNVALSYPRGHVGFALGGLPRIKANLELLEQGLVILCGGAESGGRAIPGALLLIGAGVLVGREAIGSRTLTALRFVSLLVLVQALGVLVPLIVGNLLTDKESARYLLPSLLAMLGLAVVLGARAVVDTSRVWARRLAIGWLAAVPLVALLATTDARPPRPQTYLRPDSAELALVADALVKRGLSYGFSINIAANLLTLFSNGQARVCPVHFRSVIMPHRWLTDASCFSASRLPERFFVVADQGQDAGTVIRATLSTELERFTVGDTYEIYVYQTAGAHLAWLDLPIADGELATFPMRLPATHLQLSRANVAVDAEDLVATGAEGTVVYGPYIELPRGRYEAIWSGHGVGAAGQIAFSVTLEGRKTLAHVVREARDIAPAQSELVRLSFKLDRPGANIEFPVQSGGGGRVSLHDLVIEKKP